MADLPKELSDLLSIPGNDTCMECNSENVEWASINLGIFLCESCSGRHRTLGTHISQVRSLRLDTKIWTKSMIEAFKSKGNANAKSIYEQCVPLYAIKPPKDRGTLVTENWIRDKYERRLYTNQSNENEDDSKSETKTKTKSDSHLAIHKMPCAPISSTLTWIIPNENEKYLTKHQFVVLHGRFLSRYNHASSQKCEQMIDITKCDIFVEESELNEPCILTVGCMQFAFDTYEQIKFWTECIRRSALYYTQLAQHLCAERANDTIHSLLSCAISDLDNNEIYRHLAYANMKKQGKFSVGYDKKWWMLNLQRNILYYFHKDPRTIKTNKKNNPLFVEAQGGFYLNEIIADIDNQIRSAQKHCLLIYHFDRSIFLKFDDRWPLIEFWKSLHVKGKDVLFNDNGQNIKYYEKTLNQQNMDYQVHILQQQSKKRLTQIAQHEKKSDLQPDTSVNPTEITVNGGGVGTAIMNLGLLSEESVNFGDFAKENTKTQRMSITEFNQLDLLQARKKKGIMNRQVSNVAMLMDMSVKNDANLSDDEDEEYDVQMDDEDTNVQKRDSATFFTMTATALKMRKENENSLTREDSLSADFGIFDVEKSTNYSRFYKTHNIEINDSSPLQDFDQNKTVTPIVEKVATDLKTEEIQSPIVIKQSISSGHMSPEITAQDDDVPEIKDNNIDSEEANDQNLGHIRPPTGLTSMSALEFVADNTPNLPECDSPTLAALTPDASNEQLQFDIIENHTLLQPNEDISVDMGTETVLLDVDIEKVPMVSPTLTDDGYLSEEESMMYKDHRRGTIEQYVEKNAYKSRTYRNFAQITNPDFNKKMRQNKRKRSKKVEMSGINEEVKQEEDEYKMSDSRRSTKTLPCPPPKRQKNGLELQRMYALNAVQVRKLNNSETMQFIMIQVGNMASFFVQPGAMGHKLYIKLHGTQNDSNSSHKDTHEIWEYVEELMKDQIGRLQVLNME